MNIGIDIRRTCGQITGIGVCTVNLVEALARIDHENSYFRFLGDHGTRGLHSNPYFQELVWKQIATPIELAIHKIDVFFVPNPPVSFAASCPTVLMIPDVAFCALHTGSKPAVSMPLLLYRLSARKARRVVTISDCSKCDIMRYLSVPESKIDVLPLACDQIFQPTDRNAAKVTVRERFGIYKKLILAVPGTLIRRKGTYQLLEAFALLPASIRCQYQLLVVAKKDGPAYTDFLARAASQSIASDVTVTGYVAREDLPSLYSAADLFVYPSQYEGFGLPPLEAMSCGTPVIASNTSSVPEVVSDAGLLVDPLNVPEITSAMCRVLTEENLSEVLRLKGLKRAAAFSWDRSASALLDIFRKTVFHP